MTKTSVSITLIQTHKTASQNIVTDYKKIVPVISTVSSREIVAKSMFISLKGYSSLRLFKGDPKQQHKTACKHRKLLLSFLYSAILHSQADSLGLHVILHEWQAFPLNIHQSAVLTVLTWLVPHETAAVLVCSVYTIQLCTKSLHAKPYIYIYIMCACV